MKTTISLFLFCAFAEILCAEEVRLPEQFSRRDSIWRPGINEPTVSLNKAFEMAAAQIQKAHPDKFPWRLDGVEIPGDNNKGGMTYTSYEFKFSRLVRYDPYQSETRIVNVRMDTGEATIGEIRPPK